MQTWHKKGSGNCSQRTVFWNFSAMILGPFFTCKIMTRKDAIFREKEGILGVKLEPLFFLFEVPFIAVKNSRPATPPSSLKIGRLTHKKSSHYLKK